MIFMRILKALMVSVILLLLILFTGNVYGKVNTDVIDWYPSTILENTWNPAGGTLIRPSPRYIVEENKPLKKSLYYQFLVKCLKNGAFPWKRSIKVFYNRLTPSNIGNYALIDLKRFLKAKGDGNVGSVYLDNREIEAYTDKRDEHGQFIETAPETNKVIIIKKTLDSKYKDWVKKMEGKFKEMNENPSYLMSQYFDTFSYKYFLEEKEFNKENFNDYKEYTKYINNIMKDINMNNSNETFKDTIKRALKDSFTREDSWLGTKMKILSLFNIIKEKEGLTDEEKIWDKITDYYLQYLANIYDVMRENGVRFNVNVSDNNILKAKEVFKHIAKKVKEDKDVYDITNFVELNSTKEFTISATKVGSLDLFRDVLRDKNKREKAYTLNVGDFIIDFTENDMTILFVDSGASHVIFYQADTSMFKGMEDDSKFLRDFYNSVKNGTAGMYFIKQQYTNGAPSLLEDSGSDLSRASPLMPGKTQDPTSPGLETLIISWKDSQDREHIKVIMPYRQHGFTVTDIGFPFSNQPPIAFDREIILPQGWGLSGVGQKIKLTYYTNEKGIKKYGHGIQTYLIIKDKSGNNMVLDSSIIFDKETLIRKIEELYIFKFYGDTYMYANKNKKTQKSSHQIKP